MSALHDSVLQEVNGLRSDVQALTAVVQKLVAEKTEGEQSFQDVITGLQGTRQDVAAVTSAANAALADNATQGSSTGGGSGAA